MIIRMWKGRTRREASDQYVEYLKETGVTDLRNTAGNLGVFVGSRGLSEEAKFFEEIARREGQAIGFDS